MSYKLGKCSFPTKEMKEAYRLRLAIFGLEYIGKESKISQTEQDLINLSIKQMKQVIKFLHKDFLKVIK